MCERCEELQEEIDELNFEIGQLSADIQALLAYRLKLLAIINRARRNLRAVIADERHVPKMRWAYLKGVKDAAQAILQWLNG